MIIYSPGNFDRLLQTLSFTYKCTIYDSEHDSETIY